MVRYNRTRKGKDIHELYGTGEQGIEDSEGYGKEAQPSLRGDGAPALRASGSLYRRCRPGAWHERGRRREHPQSRGRTGMPGRRDGCGAPPGDEPQAYVHSGRKHGRGSSFPVRQSICSLPFSGTQTVWRPGYC